MSIDDKYEFTLLKCNKEGTVWTYRCKYSQTPKIKCKATAKVSECEGNWLLKDIKNDHNCEPNRPKVIAEHLKHKMKECV